ncbi:hypothetical protein LCGC14_2964800 [marine sediment metagenome]|uniref:Uncharacterized protein n=1 Tax=marine sediment metagenome TaxID=412755 RepID=A0A0F9A2H7_9ZZZZ
MKKENFKKPKKGLRIIDGTPTAISKLIRENEKPQKGCGKEWKMWNPETEEYDEYGKCRTNILCPACENHSSQHKEASENKRSDVSNGLGLNPGGASDSFTNLCEKIENLFIQGELRKCYEFTLKAHLNKIHKEFISKIKELTKTFGAFVVRTEREKLIYEQFLKEIDKLCGKELK